MVITNSQEITEHLQEAGYSDVTTTALEGHSLRGQMVLAYCSDVIVGIHGAGMGWVSISEVERGGTRRMGVLPALEAHS